MIYRKNHIKLDIYNPKGFRVVRRYGLYARVKNKLSIEIIKLYNFTKQRNISEIIKKHKARKKNFKERLIETFGIDPFKCTKCNCDMILWEVWHYKYGTIYNALDRKIIEVLQMIVIKMNLRRVIV